MLSGSSALYHFSCCPMSFGSSLKDHWPAREIAAASLPAGIAATLGYRGVFVMAVILMMAIATSAIRLLPEEEPERQLKAV